MDKWPKLKLGFDVQSEIRALKVIYFTALQKLEDDPNYEDLDYEEDSENEDTKDIFGPDKPNQTHFR